MPKKMQDIHLFLGKTEILGEFRYVELLILATFGFNLVGATIRCFRRGRRKSTEFYLRLKKFVSIPNF